jgi:hypothetical protein
LPKPKSKIEELKKKPASKLIYVDGIGLGSRIYAKTAYGEWMIENIIKNPQSTIGVLDISKDQENFEIETDAEIGMFEMDFMLKGRRFTPKL